jgi:NAD(P)-dependent dehydrogenase (short-subunit alcohol dehydrogenase family)
MDKSEVVVVTGASAGLGRAIACAFARRGAHVGLIARGGAGMDGLESAKKEVEALGGHALLLPCDVADAGAVDEAASLAERELGPIDIWINNAMTSVFGPVTEILPDEFRRVTEVTYLGQVYGTMAALKRMRPRNRGTIILVGSALAYRGIPLQSAYCGAKHAIQGFADSLRSELLHDRSDVHVCMVQMPAMNTPQFNWVKNMLPNKPQPVPPIYQPEVAAEAVYWAAHHRRRELFVGKSTVVAIMGNKLFPQVGDWYLARTGFQSQQRPDQPANKAAKYNLWEPLSGDHGTHGDFDDKSSDFSPQLWLSLNRKWLLAGAGAVGLAAAVITRKRK